MSWLPVPWLAAAVCGVTLGGLYSRHYFVQLLPPLCLLAALGLVTAVRLARRAPAADRSRAPRESRPTGALAG